jgi:HSP20 family protein
MFGLSKPSSTPTADTHRELAPAVDIRQDQNGVTLVADVPGCTAKEVDITVEDGVLILRAVPTVNQPKGYHVLSEGLTGTAFVRRFTLPEGIDENGITAQVRQGVLTITVPKRPEAKPRRVTVNAA